MTPEEINKIIVNRSTDALKILMETACKDLISDAITQAKQEAYEEAAKLCEASVKVNHDDASGGTMFCEMNPLELAEGIRKLAKGNHD